MPYKTALTPTQSLVMEVLSSRLSDGFRNWTFARELGKAVLNLQARNMVTVTTDDKQNYVLTLTELGKAVALVASTSSGIAHLSWHHEDETECTHGWGFQSGRCIAQRSLVSPRMVS